MFARTSDSLTDCGPTLLTVMLTTLIGAGACACACAAVGKPLSAHQSRQPYSSDDLRLMIRRNIFTADFGRALEPRA